VEAAQEGDKLEPSERTKRTQDRRTILDFMLVY